MIIVQKDEYDSLPGFGDHQTISLAYSVLMNRMRNINSDDYRGYEYNLLFYLGTVEQYNVVVKYIYELLNEICQRTAS